MIKEKLDTATVKITISKHGLSHPTFIKIKVELFKVDLTGNVTYIIDQSERQQPVAD